MDLENRIIELEIKLTHQDLKTEELSEVVYKQQLQIENLQKSLSLLEKRFITGAPGELEIGPANEKPPHY